MAKRYKIETPDGKVIEVEGPDDATDDEIIAFTQETLRSRGSPQANNPVRVRNTGAIQGKPEASLKALATQGAAYGLSDEIMGGFGALSDAVASPFSAAIDFDPVSSYRAYRDQERATIDQTRKEMPWASTGAELAGGLLTGGTAARGALQGIAGARSLWQQAKVGGKAGAALGALTGFGYGEGGNNSVAGAGLGAAFGGPFGAALPFVLAPITNTVGAVANYLRPQNGLGRSLVGRALVDDGITPTMAAERLTAAQTRGSPLAIADLGENLRGLTGAASRAPGVSRRLVRSALNDRQAGQGERIRGAIERDLGPIGNVAEISDNLTAQSRQASAPLYAQAYQQPITLTPELAKLLETPAGRAALSKARTTMANDRMDPTAMGIDMSEAGEPILARVPSLRTLDYVKNALDDIVEESRDPVTRRLNLDRQGASVNGVRADLVNAADAQVPAYAQARAAYAGPAREKTALMQGEKSTGATADELARQTAGYSPTERAQFALGYRSKLAEGLDRRVTAGDKVGALIGTPRKQQALGQLFGNEAGFGNFAATLGDETLANETFRSVMTGSATAGRLADDLTVTDGSMLQDMAGSALKGAVNGGATGLLAGIMNGAKDLNKFGGGATGKRAREEAAALLTEVDPQLLGQRLREGLRQAATTRVSKRANARRIRNVGMFGARGLGAVSGYTLRPIED